MSRGDGGAMEDAHVGSAANPAPPRTQRRALLSALPFALYALYAAGRGELRVDHVLLVAAATALATIGPRSRELLGALYPFALVGLLYDGMRPLQRLGLSESRVLVCDLRALESRLFGWTTAAGESRTIHDWFLVHHSPALDLYCAFPYATFILVTIATTVFLYVRDRAAMRRLAWGFFLVNVAGFVTYHLLPAAPPWYFHAHGCAVDLATRPSEGPALARVDAMLGIGWFHGMYSRASSVFGALPSLHCAYPLLVVLEGWRSFGPKLRALSVAYWLSMIFASVYLDHHWLLDGLLGSSYAAAVVVAIRAGQRYRAGLALAPAPAPAPARVQVIGRGGEP